MEWFDSHLLTGIVFLPLVFGALAMLVPGTTEGGRSTIRTLAFIGSLVTFVVSLKLWTGYQPQGAEFQFMERADWLPGLGITYSLGMERISLWLILLTTFLMPIAILGSFSAGEE